MGTRGAYGFRLNGEDKVTYNHFDSYPGDLGETLVRFVQDTANIVLREIAEKLILVHEYEPATEQEISRYYRFADTGVSTKDLHEWYVLLRNAQGDPDAWKTGLDHMIDNRSFLHDSLYCEWAYIINLDTMHFEVYKGFNQNPDAPGRYASHKIDGRLGGYVGVALIADIPLDELRHKPPEKWAEEWDPKED